MSMDTAGKALVLAGDIGGTNTNLALVEAASGTFRILARERYSTQDETSLIEPMSRFLAATSGIVRGAKPEVCCISGAGPVTGDRIALTNAPWAIIAPDISSAFGFPVKLINDFTAISYGVILLDPGDPSQLARLRHTDGSDPLPTAGTSVVLGAGTGLGAGYVTTVAGRRHAFPSEGGHVGLAVYDRLSSAFQAWMQDRIGNPPGMELCVSGQGIANLFAFVCSEAFDPGIIGKGYSIGASSFQGRWPEKGMEAATALAAPERDRPALISGGSEAGDPHCRLAMEMFVRFFARLASDLSAVFLPYSGLYLAGGIASKNLPLFEAEGLFMQSFEVSYARHIRDVLRRVPVMIVKDYSISLIGAANAAITD